MPYTEFWSRGLNHPILAALQGHPVVHIVDFGLWRRQWVAVLKHLAKHAPLVGDNPRGSAPVPVASSGVKPASNWVPGLEFPPCAANAMLQSEAAAAAASFLPRVVEEGQTHAPPARRRKRLHVRYGTARAYSCWLAGWLAGWLLAWLDAIMRTCDHLWHRQWLPM